MPLIILITVVSLFAKFIIIVFQIMTGLTKKVKNSTRNRWKHWKKFSSGCHSRPSISNRLNWRTTRLVRLYSKYSTTTTRAKGSRSPTSKAWVFMGGKNWPNIVEKYCDYKIRRVDVEFVSLFFFGSHFSKSRDFKL